MRYGYCLPGGSFMPQGVAEVESALDIMLKGYKVVTEDAGYDFAECTVGLLMKLTEEEFTYAQGLVKQGKLKIERCNSMIPGNMKIVGENADIGAIREYLQKIMARVSGIGADIIVFGSGGARRVPDNFDRTTARKQIMNFLTVCNEIGGKFEITTAIEPLNFRECNILNSEIEGYEMAKELNLPYVKLLADSFHMSEVEETVGVLEKVKDMLVHTHVAEAVSRRYPGSEGGEYVKKFIGMLNKIGYSGTVTVECGTNDFIADCKKAHEFLISIAD